MIQDSLDNQFKVASYIGKLRSVTTQYIMTLKD